MSKITNDGTYCLLAVVPYGNSGRQRLTITELIIMSAIGRVDYDFDPRDAMLARVIAIATCPSVCPSVTRRYCVKTKKASGMISSPSRSPKTLVF